MQIRLDKLLAEMTTGSRREVRQWIKNRRVTVDDELVLRPESKVDPDSQEVYLDGKRIRYQLYEYYMLNKPQGVVSATTDNEKPTVVSLILESFKRDLFPVGRLDIDTEGLLLITNDGELAHRLLSPRHHVDKTYLVRIQGLLSDEDIQILEQGMDIGDSMLTMPAVVESYHRILPDQNLSVVEECTEVLFTIQEGRYHQIKRMFAALRKPVVYLKRIRMGSLVLDDRMEPGEYRRLTKEEIDQLKQW